MKIAICDDEANDAERIQSYCQICQLPYEITVFSSAAALLSAFSTEFFDLIFLDIEMEQPDGYEVGAKLARLNPSPLIIFTTKSLQYAVHGYGLAFRYLCKPITLTMFQTTLQEALPHLLPKKVSLLYNGEQKVISVNEIIYFESLARHIIFHLTENKTLDIKATMEHMMKEFPHPNFLQIHRSFCINLDYVDSASPSKVTMTDGAEIPLSRKKQAVFQERFANLVRGNTV